MSGKQKYLWFICLAVVSAAAWGTFVFFSTPNHALMRLIHVLYFAPFTFFLLKSLESGSGKKLPGYVCWLMPIIIAVFLEYIQRWTPPHNPEWKGLTASLLGVLIGVLAHQGLRTKGQVLR